ncbi:hypothetical protein PCC7424_5417 (plasmid) [Gloeothece citriformis PCC 7424]|uniref:TniQ domain-containing protein n=1 Tax=Gloeothece citriformis (strain PCC 7424) TaxID=65393 RepID=B7KMH0_GLOC7|nr:TniQ family protein [Gloeothece citriformis]ACK73992.1 hypothetical protein PCC7424_5417 [Gloeothece citriformis PCC 7424]
MHNTKIFKVYPSLNTNLPIIPERSVLYSLEPIGVGTPYCESLTSYLTRLSYEHGVSIDKLLSLNDFFTHYEKEPYPNNRHGVINHLIGMYDNLRAVNGIGKQAQTLVNCLEKLTGQNNLSYLTLLTWSEITCHRKLFKVYKSWCPRCFQEWKLQKELIYEPLIWFFQEAKICYKHQQILTNQCPYCSTNILLLSSSPGFCSKCSQWLGSLSNYELDSKEILKDEELSWQNYLIPSLQDLIAIAPSLLKSPDKYQFLTFIHVLLKSNNTLTKNQLAKVLGLSFTQLQAYYQDFCLPSLPSLISISHSTNISLVKMLTENHSEGLDKSYKITSFNKDYVKSNKKIGSYQKRKSRNKIIKALKNAITENPPPTLISVIKQLGYKNTSYFYYKFPELCHQITKRSKEYRHQLSLKNIENIQNEIEEIILYLHAQGIEPTINLLRSLMPKSGFLRHQPIREYILKLQKELGYFVND